MSIVGIIHTSIVTYPIIKKYTDEIIPDVEILHIADDTMYKENSELKSGEEPLNNYKKFLLYTSFLEKLGVNLVVLACSTLNKAVELIKPLVKVKLLEIDRPMMELAVENGNKIGIIATLESTVIPSTNLLKKISKEKKKEVEIFTRVCNEAFYELKKGNIEKHNLIIMKTIKELSNLVDVICLAQLSMSVVETHLREMDIPIPVYNSGRIGISKVKEILKNM